MKRYKNIKLKIDGDVATLTLNRPKKKNAMSLGLHRDMTSALKEVERDRMEGTCRRIAYRRKIDEGKRRGGDE